MSSPRQIRAEAHFELQNRVADALRQEQIVLQAKINNMQRLRAERLARDEQEATRRTRRKAPWPSREAGRQGAALCTGIKK
jgi:hypothetical protein